MPRQRAVENQESRRRRLTLLLSVAFLVVVAAPSIALSRLYGHLDALSVDLRNADQALTDRELAGLTELYRTAQRWRLAWFTDALFADGFLHRAAAAYLAGDYDRVVADLASRIDDPRAAHLLGCARFRIAQRAYRTIAAGDPNAAARRNAIVQQVIDEVNPDFEHAVRADTANRFAYKWNYDLTHSPEAIRRALEAPAALSAPEVEPRPGSRSPVRPRRG